MIIVSPSQFHSTFNMLRRLFSDSVSNVKALVGTFNQDKALMGAFSVIVKTSPEVLYSSEIYLAASTSRVGAYFYSPNYICISLNWAILDKLSDKWIINNKSSVPSLSWCKNFDQILYWKSGNQLWAECQSRCHQESWCICDIYQTIKLFSLPFIYYATYPTYIQWIIQICLILCI